MSDFNLVVGRATPEHVVVRTVRKGPAWFLTRDPERPYSQPACRVYWGTHGCCLPRGHEAMGIGHFCECAWWWDQPQDAAARASDAAEGIYNPGAPPHYGKHTGYYGEDA